MIRAKDRFLRLAEQSCRDVQRQTLERLLRLNSDSVFSRQHGLTSKTSVEDFQSRLDIADYEFFRPWINRMRRGQHAALLGRKNQLLMFALSSGTTARAKLIPITNQFVEDYRRGWQHWGIAAHQDHRRMRYLKMVQINSRHNQWRTEDGTPCGSISGLVTSMQRRIVRKLYAVPAAVNEIDDRVDKRHAVARFAYADPFVGMLITANPATLLQLVESVDHETVIRDIHDGAITLRSPNAAVQKHLRPYLKPNPGRARQLSRIAEQHGSLETTACWQHLECLGVWSGGSAGTYVPHLRKHFPRVSMRDHGLHASEGRMTIPFADSTSSGVLDIESHFFEFVPAGDSMTPKQDTLLAHELCEGRDYFILLTTSSGLYRYNIHDVVRCTGFHGTTPLLEFRHKGAHMSSITGEKISEAQVVESVTAACQQEQVHVMHFTLTPAWGEPPKYVLFVGAQGSESPDLTQRLAARCDENLRRNNCEYDDKRGSSRLGPMHCELLSTDNWTAFRRFRLTNSGGTAEQYKHPCLLPDPQFENRFMTAAGINLPRSA